MKQPLITSILALQFASLAVVSYQTLSTSVFPRLPSIGWRLYEIIEILTIFALATGSLVIANHLKSAWKHTKHLEGRLSNASKEFEAFVHEKFDEWDLTKSERDISIFLLKGFRISEIAGLRESSEGTIKSQLSSVYRKSGLAGRGEFTSFFLEELTAGF